MCNSPTDCIFKNCILDIAIDPIYVFFYNLIRSDFLQTDFYNPFTVEIQFYIEFFLQNTQRFVVCTINLELLGIAQIPAKFVSL